MVMIKLCSSETICHKYWIILLFSDHQPDACYYPVPFSLYSIQVEISLCLFCDIIEKSSKTFIRKSRHLLLRKEKMLV